MTGTRRAYWDYPLEKTLRTKVLSAEAVPAETHLRVILEDTLFHPEGGGQPSDVGVLRIEDPSLREKLGLGDLTVSKVLEEDDQIIHYVSLGSKGLSAEMTSQLAGASVTCVVDWDLRFDLAQQHTGQHILSRAFEELLDAKTVGFHLADDYVSIDLAIGSLSEEDLLRVEDRANEIVFSDVPVFAKEYKAGKLPDEIRTRLPISAQNIRVVYVGDYDACACGGTHVVSSGQVGLIKINKTDRAHGGVRVVFRCGGRALKDYRQKEHLLSDTAKALSQPATATPAAAIALVEKVSGLEKALSDIREALLEQEILGIIRDGSDRVSPGPLVKHLPGKSVEELRLAAKRVSGALGLPVALFTTAPHFQAIVASPAGEPDARAVTSRIAASVGGRGGGTPQLAQVGSKEPLPSSEEEVMEAILQALGGQRLT